MAELRIHYLNVKNGDCIIFERPSSGRVTVIDIRCGNLTTEAIKEAKRLRKPPGDYGMRNHPTNPVDYLTSKGISEIWRFILTHPDMDHMDGMKTFFDNKKILHFWDCGIRREKPDFDVTNPYLEEDWDFYEDLIADRVSGTKVIEPRAGDRGQFWNADNDNNEGNGDYIHIVAPDSKLIETANDNGDINGASYVVVYNSSAGPIIFPGDSNDKTWEYILQNHEDMISNAAVLFAPHHGRKFEQGYSFLDVVKPRVSFFGCAPSEHLAYSAWRNRGLLYFTNNQCGNVHVYPVDTKVKVFIENFEYANDYTRGNTRTKDGYWLLCEV